VHGTVRQCEEHNRLNKGVFCDELRFRKFSILSGPIVPLWTQIEDAISSMHGMSKEKVMEITRVMEMDAGEDEVQGAIAGSSSSGSSSSSSKAPPSNPFSSALSSSSANQEGKSKCGVMGGKGQDIRADARNLRQCIGVRIQPRFVEDVIHKLTHGELF